MAKVKVKGTALQAAIGSTSYTAIAQITGFSLTGQETETYDSRTLDGSAGVTYDPTGYVEGGSVSFDLLYDPALSGHQDLSDLLVAAHLATTGLPNDIGWKVVFANTSSTELSFTASGIGMEITGEASDGLRATVTLKVDGAPTYPT